MDLSHHEAKVASLAAAMKSRPDGQYVSIRKATPNHQARNTGYKKDYFKVDVSGLTDVLGFKESRDPFGRKVKVVVAEGQVLMGQLAKATLSEGCIYGCVPEFDNFTVAGLINGQGIQTSSFKYGVFTSCVVAMEVLLGNGDVVRCSPTERRDLFIALGESHGTVGIVTMAEIEVVPAKPFVLSTYTHFTDRVAFCDAFERVVRDQEGDFLEGLSYGPESYLMIQGNFSDTPADAPLYAPGPAHIDEGTMWYYQYTRDVAIKQGRKVDAIPTYDYLFRSMRGLYWMAECHVNLPLLTNTNWGRKKVDHMVFDKMEQNGGFVADDKNITTAELERCLVNQDMGIKLKRLGEGLDWVHRNLGVTPLWICPVNCNRQLKLKPEYLRANAQGFYSPDDKDLDFLVDIGIYGEPTVQPYYNRRKMRELMEFVDFPSMWGVSYLPKETYHKVHGVRMLDRVRDKYHAVGVFPHIDDKTQYRGASDALDLGYIPGWRLQRQFGRNWRLKLNALILLLVVCVAVAVRRIVSAE